MEKTRRPDIPSQGEEARGTNPTGGERSLHGLEFSENWPLTEHRAAPVGPKGEPKSAASTAATGSPIVVRTRGRRAAAVRERREEQKEKRGDGERGEPPSTNRQSTRSAPHTTPPDPRSSDFDSFSEEKKPFFR